MFVRFIDVVSKHKTNFEFDRINENITITIDGVTEIIELADFPLHAKFEGIESEIPMTFIKNIERTEKGLFITLFNAVSKAPTFYDTAWKEVDENGELRPIGTNGDNGGTDTPEDSSPEVENEGTD